MLPYGCLCCEVLVWLFLSSWFGCCIGHLVCWFVRLLIYSIGLVLFCSVWVGVMFYCIEMFCDCYVLISLYLFVYCSLVMFI